MDIQILSIQEAGDFDKEYVTLQALADCDVGNYILADSTYTSQGKTSNKLRHVFWFPDKRVKKGDIITVWTKTGSDTKGSSKGGKPLHRFYWNLATAVWNDNQDYAILLRVADFSTKATS